jgi:hypothetical protein
MASSKINKDNVLEGEIVQTEWDLKKIGAGLLVAALLFIAGAYILFPKGGSNFSTDTLGASINASPTPHLPNKEDVQNIIMNAKDALSEITADNLTSSQAAIQKVISDLQGLQGQSGAVGVFCNLVCKK